MPTCPTYEADPSFQLLASAGITGPYDCLAHSASDAFDHATCGKRDIPGRSIRLMTNEPVPDRGSPGLNLIQIGDVARELGIYLEICIGGRAVTWAEYERRRKAGRGTIIQVGYGPIADSSLDAGRGFRSNHGMAETHLATYDPLADGRPGAFRHDGRVYPRTLMQRAASRLVISTLADGTRIYPATGRVWAAFTVDVVPQYRVSLPAGYGFYQYLLDENDQIVDRRKTRTPNGFGADCGFPRWHRWPGGPVDNKYLVRLSEGTRAGWFLEARFAKPIPGTGG